MIPGVLPGGCLGPQPTWAHRSDVATSCSRQDSLPLPTLMKLISVVRSCYDEEDNVEPLYEAVKAIFAEAAPR